MGNKLNPTLVKGAAFALWGRTTNIFAEQAYTWGTTKGFVFGDPARRDLSGFGDLAVTLAVNLHGAPSMTPEEFKAFRANPQPLSLPGAGNNSQPPPRGPAPAI